MKRWLLCLCTLYCTLSLAAIKYKTAHSFSIWEGVAFSTLQTGIDNVHTYGGYSTTVGFGYTFNNPAILFQTGFEYTFLQSYQKTRDFNFQLALNYPTQSDPLLYHYDFSNNWDVISQSFLNVPILIGRKFATKYYFLVGPKFQISVDGFSNTSADIHTYITDPLAIDPYKNMPSHYLSNYTTAHQHRIKLNWDALLYGELGICINPYLPKEWIGYGRYRKKEIRFNIGLFAMLGLNDIQPTESCSYQFEEAPTLEFEHLENNQIPINQAYKLHFNTVLNHPKLRSSSLHQYHVGLRFSMDFQLNKVRRKKRPRRYKYKNKPTQAPPSVEAYNPFETQKHPRYEEGYRNIHIEIRDFDTGKRIDASAFVLALNYTDTLTQFKIKKEEETTIQACECVDFVLNIQKPQYIPFELEIKDYQEDTIYVELQSMQVGTHVLLNNLFFEHNSHQFSETGIRDLENTYQILKNNPTISIEIIGYTSSAGSYLKNMILSQKRAYAVYKYLRKRGISSKRLKWKGMSEDDPISDNSTPEGRKENRRVEFVILTL